MCKKSWMFFLSLCCVALVAGCGNDSGSESTEEPTESASISGINFEGGELSTVFAAGETQYTLNVRPFATSFSLNLTLPEGVTATAFAANGVDDEEPSEISIGEDNILTFALGSAADHLLINVEGDAYENTSYVFRIVQLASDEFAQITERSVDFADVLSEMIDVDDGALGDIVLNGHQYAVGMPEYDGEDAEGGVLSNSGAVFVLTPAADDSDTSWDIEMLQSPFPTAGDLFGFSLAFENELLFVAAPEEDGDASSTLEAHNDDATNTGVVYGFLYGQTTNQWVASHYIKSNNFRSDSSFGYHIDLWVDNGEVSEAELVVAQDGNYLVQVFKRSYTAATAESPASDSFSHLVTWSFDAYISRVGLSDDFLIASRERAAVDVDGNTELGVGELNLLRRQSDGTFSDLTAVS